LHDQADAEIKQGNTLANPLFLENGVIKQFDYVVANPPFSDKRWENGLSIPNDEPNSRFTGFGVPPSKNGDFAYLLHIVRSMKRNAKGAVILPHGVLFRGNAEAEIRTNLIKKGYIKGIIGLPANLFYGTGIPACIILMDKENAQNRKAVFMVDASKGFIKDGNKNRLREQDIRNITDVFNEQEEVLGYSRMVSIHEIEQNEYNLNIPRYIDSQEKEDIQDIDAHLNGGIPNADIEELQQYWKVYPNLKKSLFEDLRSGYSALRIDATEINNSIYQHPEFTAFITEMDKLFESWSDENIVYLKGLEPNCHPKQVIATLAESLLDMYYDKPLINKYNVYQHLLSYWNEVMQDDAYIISYDGWKADTYRIEVENSKGKKVDKGWTCDLVPKELVIDRYFQAEKQALEALEAKKEALAAEIVELEEEHGTEEGLFAELEKVNKAEAQKRIKVLLKEKDNDSFDELKVLNEYVSLHTEVAATNKEIKVAEHVLDNLLYAKYPTLTEDEIKTLVIDDKWLKTIETALKGEIDQISQRLTYRIKELAERYDSPLPTLVKETASLEATVNEHLAKMGFAWN
jgi:type I restriction enzyme M protein